MGAGLVQVGLLDMGLVGLGHAAVVVKEKAHQQHEQGRDPQLDVHWPPPKRRENAFSPTAPHSVPKQTAHWLLITGRVCSQ